MSQKRTPCTECWMHKKCHKDVSNEPGWGNPKAKLVILLDAPGDTLAEKLVIWLLKRMSLTGNDVWIDYIFKCPLPDDKPKKEALKAAYQQCWNHVVRNEAFDAKGLVVAGNWGVQFVLQGDMKNMHGKKDKETGTWVCYSFLYALMSPGECVEISQVIWKAAEEAGLSPKVNLDVEPFRFPSKRLV